MLKNLENKIYESVSKKGIFGLGLIPAALILDTNKYIKIENINKIEDKIGCYFYAGVFEILKIGFYSGTGYFLYNLSKKLI